MNYDGIFWVESVTSVRQLPKFPKLGTGCYVTNYSIPVVFDGLQWIVLLGSYSASNSMTIPEEFYEELKIENELYKTELFRILYD